MIVLIIAIGISALVYSFAGSTTLSTARDMKTAAALAQARDALIGYAASHPTQPGVLPCPDSDNDGSADSPCGATGVTAIGRLPWKTLGLSDLRDATGECLWYAVSANFKNSGASGPTTLNSDSVGTLVVNDTGGTPVYSGANALPAIVFAPGLVLAGQDRIPGGITVCGGNTTVANYLEGGNQNGTATDTFVTGLATTTFNDKQLAITSDALFNVVNIRVAKEAINALESYRTTNSYYPFANSYGTASPYNCTNGLNQGRFPITPTGCGQAAWPASVSAFETWFRQNQWTVVTHYAMSKACGQLGLPLGLDAVVAGLCTTLGNWGPVGGALLELLGLSDDPVTVTGISSNVRVLVIVTGRAQATQTHACTSAAQCMEDSFNTDGNSTYVKPSRFPISNDRMALTCATSSTCSVVP